MKETDKKDPAAESQVPELFSDRNTVPQKVVEEIKMSLLSGKRPVGVNELRDPQVLMTVINMIREFKGDRNKITWKQFCFYMNLPTNGKSKTLTWDQYNTIEKIATALKTSEESLQEEIWNSFDAPLKKEIILPEIAEPNMELMAILDLPVSFLRGAFLAKTGYAKPESSAYATHYGETNAETAEALVALMEFLNKEQREEFWQNANKKYLYLLFSSEIETHAHVEESMRDFWTSVDYDDIIPPEFPLIAWLQQHQEPLYLEVIAEVKNYIHGEVRSQFYEVHERTQALLSKLNEEEGGYSETNWFDDLIKNREGND